MKEKKKIEVSDPEFVVNKRGSPMVRGKCPSCGGNVSAMVRVEDAPHEIREKVKKMREERKKQGGVEDTTLPVDIAADEIDLADFFCGGEQPRRGARKSNRTKSRASRTKSGGGKSRSRKTSAKSRGKSGSRKTSQKLSQKRRSSRR